MSSNIVELYYDNGTICRRYSVNEQRKRHGLYQSWTDDGQLRWYDWYDNGLRVVEVFMFLSPIEIRIYQDRVTIDSSAFLAHIISDFDSKGIEYDIAYDC